MMERLDGQTHKRTRHEQQSAESSYAPAYVFFGAVAAVLAETGAMFKRSGSQIRSLTLIAAALIVHHWDFASAGGFQLSSRDQFQRTLANIASSSRPGQRPRRRRPRIAGVAWSPSGKRIAVCVDCGEIYVLRVCR
jgi:hypothetical protein